MAAGKNNEVDVDVGLDVQSQAITNAFNQIDARIKQIQADMAKVSATSLAAAKNFKTEVTATMRDFNKMQGTLDQFEKNLRKNDPRAIRSDAWAGHQRNTRAEQKAELDHQKQIDRAYAEREQRRRRDQDKRAREEAKMWSAHEKAALSVEEKKEKLAERRWAAERARETRLERQRDAETRRDALRQRQLQGQNQFKTARETVRTDVEKARTVADLERQRAVAADRLARARGMLGKFGAEEDRQLHQIISLERERARLAEGRIRAERTKAGAVYSDARPDRALSNRELRFELNATRDLLQLGTRRALTQARINDMLERRQRLTGAERRRENEAIQHEIRRLQLIDQRITKARQENALEMRRAATPVPTGGSGGSGIFGQTGLVGVFARTAGYGAAAAAIYSTVAAFRSGITYSIEFEDRLAKLGAVAGFTATQVEEMGKKIEQVGSKSRFSTLELAEAAMVLAQAGFTQGEIEESLGSIAQLATASGVTIAEATDVVTAAIGSFQLQASETAHINDVLASALNRTKLNIQQVALGIQYAGATAHENKISFEELTATMAVMANAGIRSGSTIGTGIRQFLVDLQTPTEKMTATLQKLGLSMEDIDVDTLGLPEVLNRMAAAGFDSAAAYGALETRAAAAYLILRNNREAIHEQIIAQTEAGQSAEAAAKGQASLTAEWQRSKNVLNKYMNESFKPFREGLRNLLRDINESETDDKLNSLWANYNSAETNRAKAAAYEELLEYSERKKQLTSLEDEHAEAIERVSTKANEATETFNRQRLKLTSLDDAISRVYVRQDELSRGGAALGAETVTLMTRFEGLAAHLDTTTDSYANLTAALQSYRAEQMMLLQQNAQDQTIALRNQGTTYNAKATSTLRAMRDDGTYGGLPADVRTLIEKVRMQPNKAALRMQLSDRARGLDTNQQRYVNSWLASITSAVSSMRSADQAQRMADMYTQLRGPTGQRLSDEVSQLPGKSNEVIKAKIEELMAARDKVRDRAAKDAYDDLIMRAQNALGTGGVPQANNGGGSGTSAAERAARTEAQQIQFGSPVDGPLRVISGVGPRSRPRGKNGQLGSRNHQGVDIGGKIGDPVRATADGWVDFVRNSDSGGYGKYIILNHGAGTTTLYAHLSEVLVSKGQEVTQGEIIGKVGQTGTATGAHLHYERKTSKGIDRNPLAGTAAGNLSEIATGSSRALEQAREEEERRAERNETALQRMRVRNADGKLKDDLDLLKGNTTSLTDEMLREQVEGSFKAWEDALRAELIAEQDRRDATDAERLEQIGELNEQIKQRRDEIEDAFFESFLSRIENGLEKLRRTWANDAAAQQQNVDMAQARLAGLQAPRNRGLVPGYVLGYQQRRVEKAEETYRSQQIAALPGKADELDARVAMMVAQSVSNDKLDATQLARITQEMNALSDEAAELRRQYALLNEEEQAAASVPRGMGDHARIWLDDFRDRNDLKRDLGFGDVFEGLDGALSSAQQSMGGFFSNIINRTKNVRDAFSEMKDAVLQSVGDMIAQLIAKQAFKWLTSLATSIVGGTPAGKIHGGQIKAFTGRYITDGVPSRDSVNARIAKGEYVVRKSAVDSVGVDFMDRLNERGSHALKSVAPKPLIVPRAEQKMNVYVVAPEHRPSMGPNDVLVTIANDIANGGQTKQLIKHVAQGG